jgi:hypothetical protein
VVAGIDDAAPVVGLTSTEDDDVGDLGRVDVGPAVDRDGERAGAAVVAELANHMATEGLSNCDLHSSQVITCRGIAVGVAYGVDDFTTWNCFKVSKDRKIVELALDYALTKLVTIDADIFFERQLWLYSWHDVDGMACMAVDMTYQQDDVMILQPWLKWIDPLNPTSCVKQPDLSRFSLHSLSSSDEIASKIHSKAIERHDQVWMSLPAFLLNLSFHGPDITGRKDILC